jgi:Tol biopolymer transport system component
MASTYDDVTGATSAPAYYTYEAQVAFGDTDGVPELQLNGTIRYFGTDGEGQVDMDAVLGDELVARRFRWDGERFSEFSAIGPATSFSFTDARGLWLWDSGQVRQLDNRMVDSLAWSPEGQLLAYEAWWPSDEQGVWLYDVETEQVERIARSEATVYTLRWSPDGGTLAYSLAQPPAIWLHDVNGEARTELAAPAERLSWAPDGEQLAYAERGNLVSYDVVSQSARVLVRALEDDGSLPQPGAYRPAWSPRSDVIACTVASAGLEQPLLVPTNLPDAIDADATSNLIGSIAAGQIEVVWSPRGDRLAILAANPDAADQGSAIYMVDVPARWAGDTRLEPRQLTDVDRPGQPVSPPAWSPDGARLAAVVGAELWLWDIESSAAERWYAFPVALEENAVRWSPDGSGFLLRQGDRIHWFLADVPGDPALLVQADGLDQVEFQPQ